MSNIFLDNAPNYWGAGIPAIPLKRWNSPAAGAGKAPILNEWTQYGEVMPTEAMRSHWLSVYPDSNIGLPFGTASGLCAIDIDSDDEEIVKAIRDVLPDSPWVRIGQKGMGLIYRWNGQANFKLRNNENQSIVEFLGMGNQMVLPPSIHPKTEKPYVSNTNLWEVLADVKPLPQDLQVVLRKALEPILGAKGFSLAQTARSAPLAVVPQGERDIQMVRHAGYLSRVVLGIDKNDKYTLREAMEHMSTWVTDFTSKSASGDDMDPGKGVAKLLEFLLKDVEGGRTLPNGWDVDLTDDQRVHPSIAMLLEKNEVQRWTYEKALAWLTANLDMKPDSANWKIEKIDELTRMVAKDENFSEAEFKLLTADMRKMSKLPMTKGDLVTQFREARRGDVESAADHEAIARQMIDKMNREGEMKFAQGKFWQWGGSCYKERDRVDIVNEVMSTIKGNSLARRYNDYEAVVKTMAILLNGTLGESAEEGINFANGFLDAALVLHDHDPKYGRTFTLPFNYVPERANEAHKWLEYLERAWGDDEDYAEKVMALQEAFAATMFGLGPMLQRVILLYGRAQTGKSQALELLQHMMPPESQCSVPPQIWATRFQNTQLLNKTLNVCGELPESATIDGAVFKGVVVGESQSAEFKGMPVFEFRPKATHWFSSNFLPRSRDTSEGFVRRWLILEFTRQVPAADRILDFHKVLISEEREAIAAWAMQALPRLMQQKEYTLPLSHHKRLNEVRRANNSVAAFLQSSTKVRVTADSNDTADIRNIFDEYLFYMKEVSKGWSVTFERFKQMLEELGHKAEDYIDPQGVMRHKVHNIRLTGPVLPTKG